MTTVALDSVTELNEHHRGAHVIVGSHGGLATGVAAAQTGVRSLVFNDAGIGLDRAGVASLQILDDLGVPAASVSSASARIGDVKDMLARGLISGANCIARELGVARDLEVAKALTCLESHSGVSFVSVSPDLPDVDFERIELKFADRAVVLCDSASQIEPCDAGRIIVTGSHGGVPGLDPTRACRANVALVFFNDAGIGIDDAGVTRLPALDVRGIPAGCVDCMKSKIGSARSTFDTGVITVVNQNAEAIGLEPGLTVKAAIQKFITQKTRFLHERRIF